MASLVCQFVSIVCISQHQLFSPERIVVSQTFPSFLHLGSERLTVVGMGYKLNEWS